MQDATSRRERKKQAVRQALEEAALRLFDSRGFGATTIDQIADEADVSRSTFFRYLGSKEAVLFNAYDDGGRALAQILHDRPESEPPLTAFENALVELALMMQQDFGAGRELAALRRNTIESDQALKLRRDEVVRRWGIRLGETLAARDGAEAPARRHLLAAAVGLAVTERITELYLDPEGSPDTESMIRSEFALLRELVTESTNEALPAPTEK